MSLNDYHVDAAGRLWRGQLLVPADSEAPLLGLVPVPARDGRSTSPAIYFFVADAEDPEPPLTYDDAALRRRLSPHFYAKYFEPSPIRRGWRRALIAIRHKLHGGHCWEPWLLRCRICGARGERT